MSMYRWACDLFPIHRHLMGDGVRQTLAYLQDLLPGLQVHSVPSGTRTFDWTVPQEWRLREAWVSDEDGNRIVDVADHNLHIVQYSRGFEGWVTRAELEQHLHSLPEQPTAIPYVTSYYAENWGFCMAHEQRQQIKGDVFHVKIDAEHFDGVLNYGELLIPGASRQEILISTYICHPSMANNELSGPVVATALAQWLASADRRYSYRFLLLPETIGALVWLSRNVGPDIVAGYVLHCIGDPNEFTYVATRAGNTLSDRAARSALSEQEETWSRCLDYTYRGSDARQYNAPGIDLPIGEISRSHCEAYPEYHTSLDNLSLISEGSLLDSLNFVKTAIQVIEANRSYKTAVIGEPQLGRRGLYPQVSTRETIDQVRDTLNIIAYADGRKDLIEIAEIIGVPVLRAAEIARTLESHGLLKAC